MKFKPVFIPDGLGTRRKRTSRWWYIAMMLAGVPIFMFAERSKSEHSPNPIIDMPTTVSEELVVRDYLDIIAQRETATLEQYRIVGLLPNEGGLRFVSVKSRLDPEADEIIAVVGLGCSCNMDEPVDIKIDKTGPLNDLKETYIAVRPQTRTNTD